MKILKDDVEYNQIDYEDEKELENLVQEHSKHIFGDKSLYFDIKKVIKDKTGKRNIPDGYVIDFKDDNFYVIEVEREIHPDYDHIIKQIGNFEDAIDNYNSRQKIASIIHDKINVDDILKAKVKSWIDGQEIYKYIINLLGDFENQTPSIVVIIDNYNKGLENKLDKLRLDSKILEFKTYSREKNTITYSHIHLFDSLLKETGIKKKPGLKTPSKKTTGTKEIDLTKEQAEKIGVTGTKPKTLKFKGEKIEVGSWREATKILAGKVFENVNYFSKAEDIKGEKRIYFSTNKDDLNSPGKIPNSPYFVEQHASAGRHRTIMSRLVRKFDYDEGEVIITFK